MRTVSLQTDGELEEEVQIVGPGKADCSFSLLSLALASNGTEECFSQTHLFCSIISVMSFMASSLPSTAAQPITPSIT